MADNFFSKYNCEEVIRSVYFFSDCDILANKLGVKDEKLLKSLEADLTNQRLLELSEKTIKGRFSVTHLKNIHKHIFQDIYPFAGKFREEDIWKGDTFFCKSQYIAQALDELLNKLKHEKFLVGLDQTTFSERAAFYMAELNMIHPFREGNGRTIREYVRSLALKSKYVINWSLIDSNRLLEASILSASKNFIPLSKCLFESIDIS